MPNQTRPTKKQQELLIFIKNFIAEHGYGPSYREIMAGCGYNSVATVALHVNNLITRGQLRKNGRSARSLELVENAPEISKVSTNIVKPSEEKWLVEKIEYKFSLAESAASPSMQDIDNLYVLVGSLKVLGLEGAANSFISRLGDLKKKL